MIPAPACGLKAGLEAGRAWKARTSSAAPAPQGHERAVWWAGGQEVQVEQVPGPAPVDDDEGKTTSELHRASTANNNPCSGEAGSGSGSGEERVLGGTGEGSMEADTRSVGLSAMLQTYRRYVQWRHAKGRQGGKNVSGDRR